MSSNSTLYKLVEKLDGSEKWMVAAWVVEDGKIKLVDRITHRFPTDDFLAAIGQLAHNCHEEKLACDKAEKLAAPREELPSDPLPPVKIFKMPHCEKKNEVILPTIPKTGDIETKALEKPILPVNVTELAKEFLVEDKNALLENSVNGDGYPKIDNGVITPTNENGKTE